MNLIYSFYLKRNNLRPPLLSYAVLQSSFYPQRLINMSIIVSSERENNRVIYWQFPKSTHSSNILIIKSMLKNIFSPLKSLYSKISFHDWLYEAFKSLLHCWDYLIRWWWKFKHLFHYTKVELCGFVKLLECWQKSFWKWAASIDRNMPSSSLLEQLNGNDNCVCKGNTFCFITLYFPCKAFCQQICDKNFVFIFVFVTSQKPMLHDGRPDWC